jgi:SAM-dependent methyltransferase
MAERLTPGAADWVELAGAHLSRYLFALDYGRGGRVLDAGTGCGYGARLLKAGGAACVQAIDIHPEALRLARERYGGEGIEFLVDDCQELGRVAGPFDLVTSFENIEHLAEPERFLAAAGRVLAPNGALVVSTPDRAASPPYVNGRPKNPFHLREWYREEFRELLAGYFEEVDLRAQVESAALRSRIEAVAALGDALMWTSPLVMCLWRKLRRGPSRERLWKKLAGLAAPTVGDYPLLPLATAEIFGKPAFHVAVCRKPKSPWRSA